jgi:hypothetical protein
MSIPRNHHFISQTHIRNFFNLTKGEIYLYDKIKRNHYYRRTPKSIFSEIDLNSTYDNGLFDHASLENDLRKHFEDDFPRFLDTIKQFIINENFSSEVNNALLYFAKYGIIGEVRNPRYKKKQRDTVYNAIIEILKGVDEKFQNEIDEAFAYKKQDKYLNVIEYSKFANEVLKLMGNLVYVIEIPENENDYFLLPDFCAANRREKINEYFNPDVKEIAYIGLPLTSKIYIHFYSTKIPRPLPESGIYKVGSSKVYKLNEINLHFCESKVACENESYLKEFISQIELNSY